MRRSSGEVVATHKMAKPCVAAASAMKFLLGVLAFILLIVFFNQFLSILFPRLSFALSIFIVESMHFGLAKPSREIVYVLLYLF